MVRAVHIGQDLIRLVIVKYNYHNIYVHSELVDHHEREHEIVKASSELMVNLLKEWKCTRHSTVFILK